MRRAPRYLALALGAALTAAVAAPIGAQAYQVTSVGDQGTYVIRGARIVTLNGPDIENGTVVIRNGRIEAVGASVQVPANARLIEAAGLTVYPGMMDAATNMGLVEIPQGANPTVDLSEPGDFNPQARAIVAIHPHSQHFAVSRMVGVTSVVSMPRGGLIAGQAATINLAGSANADFALTPHAALVINLPRTGGGGFGFGGGFGGFGGGGSNQANRDKQLADLRSILRDAESYGRAHAAYAADRRLPRPAEDVVLASLVPYVRGERPVIFGADRAADIRSAVQFATEMNLKPIIMGGTEAYLVTDLLRQRDVPVILTSVLRQPAREDDPYSLNYETAGKLHRAGVRFSISTGNDGSSVRDLPFHAGMASAHGLPKGEALKAVTLAPAQIMNVADRIGSIEVGKVANIVVTDGDLLEPRTNTRYLFIDGRPIELTSRHEELYKEFRDRKRPVITP
ncbi:MAG TPA: amidohydrolase family protein [Gemmatimonadaceae bacterium]|nr:amidohydrolase family protein [Gemmatimonadaceae bacterium]